MIELLFTIGILSSVIFLMAIGYIFKQKALKGSCGGLGAIMGDDCMFCEKKDQCEKKKKQSSELDNSLA